MLTSLTPKPKRTSSPHLRLATESWGLSVHIFFICAGLGTLDSTGRVMTVPLAWIGTR